MCGCVIRQIAMNPAFLVGGVEGRGNLAGTNQRAIEPGNVILTAGGARLLDFGLAKLRQAERGNNIDQSTQTLRLTEHGTPCAPPGMEVLETSCPSNLRTSNSSGFSCLRYATAWLTHDL
jgi:hypothetical protein